MQSQSFSWTTQLMLLSPQGQCKGSSVGGEVRSWIDDHKPLVIGLAAGLGSLILLSILGCCISSCRRRRNNSSSSRPAQKLPPQPAGGWQGWNGAPPPQMQQQQRAYYATPEYMSGARGQQEWYGGAGPGAGGYGGRSPALRPQMEGFAVPPPPTYEPRGTGRYA